MDTRPPPAASPKSAGAVRAYRHGGGVHRWAVHNIRWSRSTCDRQRQPEARKNSSQREAEKGRALSPCRAFLPPPLEQVCRSAALLDCPASEWAGEQAGRVLAASSNPAHSSPRVPHLSTEVVGVRRGAPARGTAALAAAVLASPLLRARRRPPGLHPLPERHRLLVAHAAAARDLVLVVLPRLRRQCGGGGGGSGGGSVRRRQAQLDSVRLRRREQGCTPVPAAHRLLPSACHSSSLSSAAAAAGQPPSQPASQPASCPTLVT